VYLAIKKIGLLAKAGIFDCIQRCTQITVDRLLVCTIYLFSSPPPTPSPMKRWEKFVNGNDRKINIFYNRSSVVLTTESTFLPQT
jgi:hypothetical protein